MTFERMMSALCSHSFVVCVVVVLLLQQEGKALTHWLLWLGLFGFFFTVMGYILSCLAGPLGDSWKEMRRNYKREKSC